VNKSELIRQLAQKTNLSQSTVAKVVDAMFSTDEGVIADALASGEKVQLTGFGTFEIRRREARKGRNPRTGKEILIHPTSSATFRPGKQLKDVMEKVKRGTGSTGPRRH
jgi:DNA-binding protein HU-beta